MRCDTCAILAGGAARRFGGITKSKLVVGGKPVISRILEAVEILFEEVVIVSNDPGGFSGFGKRVLTDILEGIGPLGGIHASLKASRGEAVFVLAGDMPFPDKKIITQMIERFEVSKSKILTPFHEGQVEPLHSIYSVSLAGKIEQAVSAGIIAVHAFLEQAETEYFVHDSSERFKKAFMNINSPGDIAEAEKFIDEF